MAKILLLNDHQKIREQIRMRLCNAGHKVETVGQPFSPGGRIEKNNPDLVILDTDLDHVDGFYIMEKPVLVTALNNNLLIMLDSIERGASDYLILPSSEEKPGKKVNSIIEKK
ncbi:MAG: response regulator [Spirochaetes bacterium]|nr:response regulator [Spirochaetota bacterium]